MTGGAGLGVAVVGLGFGDDFVPLYQAHPDVDRVAVVDPSGERLTEVGDRHGVTDRFPAFEDVLDDPRWDAVHVLAPVSFHAGYTLAALRAGKHVACAVPMATELADLDEIVRVQGETGRHYMMMETTVYAREYRAVERMHRAGELGELSMYRGVHIQNLDGYPRYWLGYPPMQYITHALSPALALTGTGVLDLVAYGSGTLTPDRVGSSGNPYPAEVGLFRLRGSNLVADVTMSFFQAARPYTEGFSVYGSRRSVEWPAREKDPARLHELQELDPAQQRSGLRGRRSVTRDLVADDGEALLPASLRRFVRGYELSPADGGPGLHRSAEHGGSHPHLVHEFVSAVVSDRAPRVDARTAAAWTAPGICAHESAMADGARVAVPDYLAGALAG